MFRVAISRYFSTFFISGSLNKLLESRQKKIEALETTLKEVRNENSTLKQSMEVQKIRAGGDNQVMETKLKTVVEERDELRANFAKVKIDTNGLSEEVKIYKKKLEKLQESLVDKQIENSTLTSQSSSL